MAISLGTVTRTTMMQGGMVNLTILRVFSGARPAPDDVPTGTLLASFSIPSLTAVDGQVWIGAPIIVNALATGTATWARWGGGYADPDGPYTPRIDGTVGVTTGDFKLDTVDFVIGELVQLNTLRLTLPSE